MAGKNTIRIDVEGGYYHVYNRGVEKRTIFQDNQDYGVYLGYLKEYLLPKSLDQINGRLRAPGVTTAERERLAKQLRMNNFHDQIELMAYCLMPNHFHLFLKQGYVGSMDQFMNSLNTRYVMYFNRKYERVGPLYQGRYKAVMMNDEAQYLHITRYIHKQALSVTGTFEEGQPSSYSDYVAGRKTEWLHTEEILSFFSATNPSLSYERFVAEYDSFKNEADDLD